MQKKIIFACVLFLSLQNPLFAKDDTQIDEKIISATFKSLAKAFVAVTDINKLKQNNISRLNKISDEKFQKQYAKVYKVIKELPEPLKAEYGITEQMSRQQAIKNTVSVDKNKIYQIIDAVPDKIIAGQFKDYLRSTKQKIQKSSLVESINKLWEKIIRGSSAK